MKVIIIKCQDLYINRKIPFQTYLTIIKKKEVVRFYKTFNYPERIVSVIKSDFYTNGDERPTEIKTDFDVQKNWIRKHILKTKNFKNNNQRN
jgi:hypothetical protein